MANISEDMADKYSDPRRKVKFISKKEKDTGASSSAASSGDEDNDDSFDNTSPSLGQSNNTSNSNTSYIRSRKSKKRAVWEVIEGYRDPNMKVQKPQNYEGILLKRRNWPMKGWHKRYFILADGILSYGKSKADLTKNKIHGTLNAYLSIVSYITTSRRILIDSSTQSSAFVCHLKARNQQEFDAWLENLKQHRLYYQYKYTQQYTPQPTIRHTNMASNQVASSANTTITNSNQPQIANSNNQVAALNSNGINLPALNVIDDSNQTTESNKTNANIDGKSSGAATSAKASSMQFSSIVADDNTIDMCFKQVEDSLAHLSRTLGSIYLSTLATSSSNTAVNSTPGSSGTYSTGPLIAATSSPSTQLSQSQNNSSIDFMSLNTNSSKIHVSKSNPNLINNELQLNMLSNYANSNATAGIGAGVGAGTANSAQMAYLPTISVSSNNSSSSNGSGSGGFVNANTVSNSVANSGSSVVQNLLSSSFGSSSSNSTNTNAIITSFNNLNTTNQYANQNQNGSSSNNSNLGNNNNNSNSTNYNPASSPNLNSRNSALNLSTNSLAIQSDEQLFKINFYQGAKQINDQLLFLYQQLLNRRQNLLSSANSSNLDIENQLQRSQRSQSVMSSVSLQDSQLPFYDAIEYFTSDTESDDDSDQESDAENNLSTTKSQISAIVPEELQSQKILNRRRKLPAPAPDSSQISVWGIMRKAIGKDLSKISLPVILNEPLSILQRLSEELEYSDLLDNASNMQDPYDRMVQVAAFVISGYASSYYRNGAKNFNPLLGETYELVRPDKGWRYVAEQVSHHPPVSCCHCQSKTFIHEQLFHAKVKFWGKSMEVHPEGYSRVTLPKFNETYQWNKIVMYVYNVMGTSRRIEHYGEITIRSTNGVSCSITFPKASYSSQKNEFYGDVIFDNVVKRKIFGQWHEAFLCGTDNTAKTIWRMSSMPEDSNLYYGFTRFAIELNEFTENLKDELPLTDSRFRPDQRHLEEGQVEKAELEKQRIEDMQRKRRREMEQRGEEHQPLWFNSLSDSKANHHDKEWAFNGQYWSKRENPGFKSMKNSLPKLW